MLDEMFHVFKQLKEDNFDVQCSVMWEILHVAQCCCTEQHRGGKAKGRTLGDAYPCVDFQDVAGQELLAWAIHYGVLVLGRVPDMSGYQDWDCIVVGTLVPLIYQGEIVWDHCGPTTVAGANAQRVTELTKEQGFLHNKERRAHIASSEAHVALLEALAQRAPAVKSKVTMLPRARSSCSGEGLPIMVLDQLSGPEEEVSSPGASCCQVL